MHFFGIPNVNKLSGQEIIRKPIGFTVQKKCGVFCGMFLSFQFTKCGEILRWQRLECYPEKNGVHFADFVHVFHKIKMLADESR